jgi:predicted N-acetyltransferase YhbS
MTLTIRPARAADAAASGAICEAAFRRIATRHDFAPDFPSPEVAIAFIDSLIGRGDVHAVVAEQHGRVVGSNFLWAGSAVAGVGPITVDPEAQDRGVGRRLMQAVLEAAIERGCAGVRLVQAGYHMRSLALYTKLGFVVREPLLAMQGAPLALSQPGRTVRPASTRDLAACDRLHRAVHGFERNRELAEAMRQETALVVERDDGELTGYATQIGFFGHAVARGNDDLKALIGAAPAFAGPGFLLPSLNVELLAWCLRHGLRAAQPMTLMSIGLYNAPAGVGLPSVLF